MSPDLWLLVGYVIVHALVWMFGQIGSAYPDSWEVHKEFMK